MKAYSLPLTLAVCKQVRLDGDSDDEGAATENYSQLLLETLGVSGRNDVLAKMYLVRCDVAHAVRNAAVHVWKSVVVNTPRTLKEVLPRLLEIAIEAIAGAPLMMCSSIFPGGTATVCLV